MLPVYCDQFGLMREPFSVTPDPSFLYLSPSHKEALAQLIYGIRARRGFIVLTGEVGTGKTTLIQKVLEEIKDDHTLCAFLFHLTGGANELLRSLCQDFSLVSPLENDRDSADYLTLLNRFLLESYRDGDNVAVIIDEAQNLSVEVLERIRLLSNFETKQDKLLQIVLVGQPELSDRLNQPDMRQLKQRVVLRHHLSPLNSADCKDYIAKRLEIAGAAMSLFSASAIETVHAYSGGVPRLVNILCDNGLLSAYGLRKPRVDAEMIAEIAHDLHLDVARRKASGARESVAQSSWEAPLRGTGEGVVELTDAVEVALSGRDSRKLFGLPARSRPESAGESATGLQPVSNGTKQAEGGSAAREKDATDLVPQRYFDAMIRVLTESVGPMAAIIVRDHIVALGGTRIAFPRIRLDQLVHRLSREIANESERQLFESLMSEEYRAITSGERKK